MRFVTYFEAKDMTLAQRKWAGGRSVTLGAFALAVGGTPQGRRLTSLRAAPPPRGTAEKQEAGPGNQKQEARMGTHYDILEQFKITLNTD